MAGYSARQSTFTTGDTITAAHSNNEFNAILAAFHVSTGHKHDGSTAGDGGPISTLFSNAISMGTGADTDIALTFNANTNDGVITWMEDEDYFKFSDEVLIDGTEKLLFRDTAIYINSSTDGQLDIVADTEIQIAATTIDMNGNVDISGSLTLGGTTITSTGAELNILDGVTSTAAELNILDGVTSTAAELNILDGVTSTAAELNILDGVTSTATELNVVDGGTSATSTTVADADRVVYNDAGTMKQVAVTDLDTYISATSKTLTNKTLTSPVLNTGVSGTAVLDEDNLASDSATKLATQQSIKAYVDGQISGVSSTWTLEDDDGTEVGVASGKEVKFIGSGITTNWTDTDNGTDADPYDMTFTVDAAQTGITSLLAADIKIGEDNETKIDFEEANEIHFYAANAEQVYVADGIFGPETDSDVDLGSTGVRWKDAFVDSLTITDNITVGGDLTVNGTTTTVNSTTVTIDDPIFTLGGDSAPGSDDNKDRGIEFRWHNGSAAKVGFFGYDDNAAAFTFIPDATNSSEVFSGTVGNAIFGNITGTLQTAAQTNITSVGALDAGSITSNFGTINTGSSNITTTGAISGGTLAGTLNADQLSGTVANARLDAELQALAGLTSAADKGIQFTGSGTAGVYDLTTAGKALLDDADAAAQRTTLGLGTAATQAVGTSASNVVQLDGSAKLPAVDGSALTNLVAGGVINKVADGDIAIRKPVILTSAGKAQEVATSVSDAAAGVGTALTLDSSVSGSDSRTVLVYMDGIGSGVKTFLKIFCDGGTSNHITAIAFTISDTGERTITAGTPVVVTSNDTATMDAVFDPDTDRVIMVYRNGDASDQAYYSVISVSGTTVTASTVATLNNDNAIDARDLAITYDTSADRLAVVYYDQGGSGAIRSYVGTVTGGTTNSVAWGSNVDAEGAASNVFTRLCYDVATNRHLLVWRNDSGLQSKVGTLTGSSTNTIAWGSTTTFNTTSVSDIELPMLAYEATQEKCVLGWFSGSSTQKFGVVTVTGASTNTAAIGSLVSVTIDYVLHEPNSNALSAIAASKVAYVYNVSDTVKVVPFTISGTSLSAGTAVTVASADTSNIQIAGVVATGAAAITFETNNVSINAIEYRSAVISGGGTSSTNLDNGNYLGISAAAISDTATGVINVIGGTSTGHSSLTIGNHYFTNGAGAIGLVGNTTGEQYLGRAISATEIQLLENEGYLYGTAEGAVTAGKPVIVEADGDFAQVGVVAGSVSEGLGTKTTTELAATAYDQQAAMGINGQFVSVYRQGNDYMCQVNTVSAADLKTITHGTSQLTFNLSSSTDVGIIYQPDADKYVLFYKNASNYLTGSVMTVSGTGASATLATATAVVLRSDAMNGSPNNNNFAYDTTNDVIVGAWIESGTIKSVSMPISGTTISANGVNNVTANSGSISSNQCRVAYSSTANKVIWFYSDGSSEDLYTTVGSVNGTGLDFGSTAIVSSLPTGNFNGQDTAIGVDSNGVVVISYLAQDISPSYTLFSQAGTLSSTTISWGSPSQVSNVTCLNNAGNECSIAPIASGKMIIARATRSDSASNADKGIFAIVTSSGTTVSNGSVQIYSSTASRYPSLAVNYSNNQAVINWGDAASMDMNNIVYIESSQSATNLTSSNYIGIATKTVADDAQVEVATFGQIDAQQSGLTAGQVYYTQTNGTLSTTADTPSSVTGKALSATKLLIQ